MFDLTTKYIIEFFVFIFVANYVNFLGFNELHKELIKKEKTELIGKTNTYFWVMNGLYALVAVLTFFPWFEPLCSPQQLYPRCFTAASVLYWINYGYNIYLSRNDYWLKWEDKNKEMKELNRKYTQKLELTKKESTRVENLRDNKKLFEEQVKMYNKYTLRVSIWNLFIQVLAICAQNHLFNMHFLGCMEGGWRWSYLSILGSLFTLFHMMSICM